MRNRWWHRNGTGANGGNSSSRAKAVTSEMVTPTEDTNVTIVENNQQSSGDVSFDTAYDVESTNTINGNLTNDFDINIYNQAGDEIIDGSVVNNTPSIVTVTKNVLSHEVRHISDGTADLRVYTDTEKAVKTSRHMKVIGAGFPDCDITGLDVGSLAENAYNNALAMTSGVTAGTSTMKMWDSITFDWQNPIAVPNPNLFMSLADWDLSGVSVMRQAWGYNWGHCTLISPRHVITAFHLNQYPDGPVTPNAVVFRTPGGVFKTANIIHAATIGWDIQILYLDTPITDCKIYKVFSALTYETYVASMANWLFQDVEGTRYYYNRGSLPAVRVSSWDYGVYGISIGLGDVTGAAKYRGKPTLKMDLLSINREVIVPGNPTKYLLRYEELEKYSNDIRIGDGISLYDNNIIDFMGDRIGGDSGSPWFVPLDFGGTKELVLTMVMKSVRESDDLTKFITEINTAMNTIADISDADKGSYALLEIDLSSSGFNTY